MLQFARLRYLQLFQLFPKNLLWDLLDELKKGQFDFFSVVVYIRYSYEYVLNSDFISFRSLSVCAVELLTLIFFLLFLIQLSFRNNNELVSSGTRKNTTKLFILVSSLGKLIWSSK